MVGKTAPLPAIAAIVVLAPVVVCGGALTALFGGAAGQYSACQIDLGTNPPTITTPTGGWAGVGDYDTEQVTNAATIAAVGADRGVPIWGWIVAVATAIQESGLRNLTGGDLDSVGLFQQRPSQGWGTVEELTDPVHAAGAFYDALLDVEGWQTMALTDAAQAVQRSAYPDAYAKWRDDATTLVATVLGLVDTSGTVMLVCSTWTQPVDAAIVSGFRSAERPDHDGVDLAAARGTPILAASAGTVVTATCNASTGDCDVDGSPAVSGCGWYVDIQHDGDLTTRYCHMLTQPPVTVGQSVTTGETIGLVGSSGHSSGPHLHYEVHLANNPIDPAEFMDSMGAPLG